MYGKLIRLETFKTQQTTSLFHNDIVLYLKSITFLPFSFVLTLLSTFIWQVLSIPCIYTFYLLSFLSTSRRCSRNLSPSRLPRNVSFLPFYGGQFTFSTQLLTLNYMLYSPTDASSKFLYKHIPHAFISQFLKASD